MRYTEINVLLLISCCNVHVLNSTMKRCERDQKTLFKVTKKLLGKNEEVVLPTSSSSEELAQNFSDFFIDKIDGIRNKIRTETEKQNGLVTTIEVPSTQIDQLVEFTPVSQDEVKIIVTKSAS